MPSEQASEWSKFSLHSITFCTHILSQHCKSNCLMIYISQLTHQVTQSRSFGKTIENLWKSSVRCIPPYTWPWLSGPNNSHDWLHIIQIHVTHASHILHNIKLFFDKHWLSMSEYSLFSSCVGLRLEILFRSSITMCVLMHGKKEGLSCEDM